MSDWDTNRSPFAPMIGTNYIPTAVELSRLKAMLVHPMNTLSSLELDIDHAQATLDALLHEKQRVKSYVDAHRALLSPVRQIPPETLAEIFAQCLPSDPPYGLRDLTKAPLLLTTICKDWRHIALATPRLWNSLHVHFPGHLSIEACAKRVQGVIAWLERSGFGVVLARRAFFGGERYTADNSALLSNIFPRVPCLQAVSLQLSIGNNQYSLLPCNWQHLTTLTISSAMNADHALDVLAQVPQMRALDLMIDICQGISHWKDKATVLLNNLSKLRLSFLPTQLLRVLRHTAFESKLLSLFGCIHCPALQSFSFSCPNMLLVSKLIFVSLPLVTLEELELEMTTTPEVLMECLSLTPNLISFKFTDSTYRPKAVRWLRPLHDLHIVSLTSSPSNLTPCWPRLESIQILNINTGTHPTQEASSNFLTLAALTRFLHSRAQSSLKTCHILFQAQPSFSKMELDSLRSLERSGMNLRFSYLDNPNDTEPEFDLPDTGLVLIPHDTAICKQISW
ncbi:hypothetical protein BDP27DRAFT_1339283 [Rhodocollybia butyracea]|uniref:F-box domain-containing protein n=1 Tax=Rhodocollybia butyracea TaxID=206335 RepID=A0A9P5TYN6_9AGAR|nr:hypothetical protein BDP27DRAFT_1339283 [Rhodocollybia butyracea]